jgi:hypothetical protein
MSTRARGVRGRVSARRVSGHERLVRRVRRRRRARHTGRTRAQPGRIPRRRPGPARARVGGVHPAHTLGGPSRSVPVVVACAGRGLAPSPRSRIGPVGAGRPPGRARRLRRHRRLRRLGRQAPADRAEWEYAARGRHHGLEYAKGDDLTPTAVTWPTCGRANSEWSTTKPTAGTGPHPWARSRQ